MKGKAKRKGEPARTAPVVALSEEHTSEIDIDDGAGPANRPMKELRGRATMTMYKDVLHACADHDTTMTDLINEGLRYILYGTPPRHVAVRKKMALSA